MSDLTGESESCLSSLDMLRSPRPKRLRGPAPALGSTLNGCKILLFEVEYL